MQLTPRGKFLLLLGVFALPVVAAAIAYLGWRPSAHGNYGELLRVTPLQKTVGTRLDGQALDFAALRGQWLLVRVGGAACGAACAQQLYLSRQIRTALGKDQSRVERVWVLTDTGTPAAALLAEHPGLVVWRPAAPDFAAQFLGADGGERLYVVDPLGNLMMRFPAAPDPKRVLKDLRLLLKASQIG
ncbi:MAG: hypothetical protein LDL19_00635 [Thiobacillus sp.]|nr:hypothetical protein [Thiobacillus sp.]